MRLSFHLCLTDVSAAVHACAFWAKQDKLLLGMNSRICYLEQVLADLEMLFFKVNIKGKAWFVQGYAGD